MNPSEPLILSRRSFIKTSALAGGGMLIGFTLFQACKPTSKPPIDISKLNFNDFNAFIKISDEGKITIFSPNPEIGQGVKTSMPMLIAEELDVAWEDVFVAQGMLDTKNFTRQVAGGSQSIRKSWEPLRQTGATARQMLINAAAKRWNVEPSECTTQKGIITSPKGNKLGYGEVVKEAATLEIPEKITLKDPKEFAIIGKEIGNVDIDNIITGKPLYGLDYKAEGMQYATVARPPAFGQTLISFDDTAAKNITGVHQIVALDNKVAVLASNTWAAIKGKKALKISWKQDTPAENTAFHNRKLTELLNGKTFETLRKDGNIEKAFAEADNILERTYESPFLPHNCMEPMNFFAHVTPDKVNLTGPIQTPERTAQQIAEKLQINEDKITLQMTRMGGGFGRRLYGDFAMEAVEISNLTKKPVKLIYTREDDMSAGIYRPAIKYRIAASIKNGQVTGYHLKEAAINRNMYNLIPHFFPAGAIENYQVDVARYESNITTGAWRAPYTNFLASAEQSFFDELAETMNIDRVQLYRNLLQKVNPETDNQIEYNPQRLEGVMELVLEKSKWGKTPQGIYQGLAVYYCHNTHVAEVVNLALENKMPVVKKVTCAIDCGIVINPLGAKNQVAGAIIDGIGHALYGELTFENGMPQSNNFNTYQLIRMNQTPQVEIHFVKNEIAPTGLGEPALPPAMGALANALYKATGQRLTKQPYMNYLDSSKITT